MSGWPAKKNAAFVLSTVIYDNDGDPVSGAAALDSEVSIDSGGFTDCTNEAAEDGTSGTYDLALTADEMNGNVIKVIVKTSTPNAKTSVNIMYTSTRQIDDLAFPTSSGRSIDVTSNGNVGIDWGNVESPTTEINFSATTIKTATDVETDTAVIGALGAGLTGVPWNSAWDAEVQSEVDDALVALNLDHLAKVATAAADMTTEVVDNSILSRILGNGDTSTFVPSTDGLHAAGVDLDAILMDTGTTLDGYLTTIDGIVDDILLDTNELQTNQGNWLTATGFAVAGDEMDLVDAPNGTAITAIQSGLATGTQLGDGTVVLNSAYDAAKTAAQEGDAMTLASEAIAAAQLATDAVNAIADGILSRDIDNVEATAALHSLTTAILKAVSKVIDDAGTLKVYRTNGSTLHMSQTLTTDANNEPIDSVGVGS